MAVRTANGTRWVLKMLTPCTALELRQQIAMQLHIPVVCQKLSDPSGAILECSDELLSIGTLDELMLVISLEDICTELNQGINIEKALRFLEPLPKRPTFARGMIASSLQWPPC